MKELPTPKFELGQVVNHKTKKDYLFVIVKIHYEQDFIIYDCEGFDSLTNKFSSLHFKEIVLEPSNND